METFNSHFESDTSYEVKKLKDLLLQSKMEQIITSPTHRSGHTIDWVIVKKDFGTIRGFSVQDLLISDRHTIMLDLPATKPPQVKKIVKSRNVKNIDMTLFSSDLKTSLECNDHSAADLDNYNSTVRAVLDTHAPLITRIISERPYAPWYCQEVKEAKSECRRAEQKCNKTGLTIHKDMFKTMKQSWKKVVKNAKHDLGYVPKMTPH